MRLAATTLALPRWHSTDFPDDLAPATARLRLYLESRIDPDGAVREPCHSRVLESALLLVLLDRTRLEPAARDRLARYLAAHRQSPTPLDRLLARACLDGPSDVAGQLDVDDFLSHAPDFTGPRKRALLHAVLVLVGAVPATDLPTPDAFCLHGLHTWARVQVTAVKTILAHAHARPDLLDAHDMDLLRSTQQPGTVWEGHLLVHLSVLHALATQPGHQQLIADGIHTALQHQRPDGGIPFICDEDTWVTANAGVALHTAGAPAPVLDRIAQRLLHLQQPGGGWSYTEGAQLTDADDISASIEVLHLTGPHVHRQPISRAMDALLALRGPDGGFPTYQAGAPSEACITAGVANALCSQADRQHTAIDEALTFLASQQHPDGSFPPDWSKSRLHTVFRATLAATRHPSHRTPNSAAQRITSRAAHLVTNSQNTDGGWGQQHGDTSDATSTAYALITLAAHSTDPAPAARGAAYILTQQRPDGSITSIPDSIGPRGFAFTVPVLADIFSLLALGHLARRLAPAPPQQISVPARRHRDFPVNLE